MALKFFWTYIGVFLACSVTLAMVVKQFSAGFAASGKKPLVYGAVSSLAASGVAYISSLISDHMFTVFWILATVYLLFGIVHYILVHNKYFAPEKQTSKIMLGEIMFGFSLIFFSIVIFSSLQYFVTNEKDFLFYPVLISTIFFFVPFLFMQTFDAAYNIPAAIFKTWQYPLNEQIDVPDERPGEKLVVIGFEIAKKTTDKTKSFFRAKGPEAMILGDLYYHFINDYNEAQSESTIQYTDDDYEPQEWWFRKKPKWFQRQSILHPDITIRENGIKENTVIICERLKK